VIEDSGWLYLELSDALKIRERWGLAPVHDAGKLESALARPRQGFGDRTLFPDAPSKAAALGWGVTRSHGLVDGNKRLGAIATLYFLHANGYDAAVTESELVAIFYEAASGDLGQEEIELFLRPRITPAPVAQPKDELLERIRPHLDAIHLFTQQAGTEEMVQGGDFWMVMDHVNALLEIATELPEGTAREALLGVITSFAELAEKFRFVGNSDDQR
jgi:death-on-curing protein